MVVFTLGNSTDAFLLLRATQLGIPVASAPLLWLVLQVVNMLSSTSGGALTEVSEKAMIADLVPARRRWSAFGWYHAAVGIAALPASLLFGVIWDRF